MVVREGDCLEGDVRAGFSDDRVRVWDLEGRDRTVVIVRIEVGRATRRVERGKKVETKPILFFRGSEKGFVCNITNVNLIAGLYGYRAKDWIGKPITLYPTTTTFGPHTVDCIRVRPVVPTPSRKPEVLSDNVPVDEKIRAEQEAAAAEAALGGGDPEGGP